MERDHHTPSIVLRWGISTHTLTWSVTEIDEQKETQCKFQLTRSRGAWRVLSEAYLVPTISTHTLTWSVTDITLALMLVFSNFNSHAHVERDVTSPLSSVLPWTFQLTRSRGAWPVNLWVGVVNVNFNSHAHVERDGWGNESEEKTWISTHTLTWSVTTLYEQNLRKAKISTHTLTWSVTIHIIPNIERGLFQLTRSRGAWRYNFVLNVAGGGFQLTRSRGAWPIMILT